PRALTAGAHVPTPGAPSHRRRSKTRLFPARELGEWRGEAGVSLGVRRTQHGMERTRTMKTLITSLAALLLTAAPAAFAAPPSGQAIRSSPVTAPAARPAAQVS